jgi:hypothetical protein
LKNKGAPHAPLILASGGANHHSLSKISPYASNEQSCFSFSGIIAMNSLMTLFNLSSRLVRERNDELEIYCKAWPVREGKRFSKQTFTRDLGTASYSLSSGTRNAFCARRDRYEGHTAEEPHIAEKLIQAEEECHNEAAFARNQEDWHKPDQ